MLKQERRAFLLSFLLLDEYKLVLTEKELRELKIK